MEPQKLLTYHHLGSDWSIWHLEWSVGDEKYESYIIFDGAQFNQSKFIASFNYLPVYAEVIDAIEKWEFN